MIPDLKARARRAISDQGRDEHAGSHEELSLLRGPEPLGPRALSGGRILRDASSPFRRRTSAWSSSTRRRRSIRSKRPTPPARWSIANTFSPKIVEREYLEKFPGWSRVKVTTGWMSATVDGQTAIDARIATDPERFWDIWQSKTLPKIYDNVMKITGNRPTADKQPFHRDLDIEVWMSEPDFRIGDRRGAGLVARVAARGSLFRDARLLQRARPEHDRQPASRPRPAKCSRSSILRGKARRRSARILLYAGNARRARGSTSATRRRARTQPTRVSRELTTHRHVGAAGHASGRRTAIASREIELQTEPKDDREAHSRRRRARRPRRGCTTPGLCKTELSHRPRRSHLGHRRG